MRLARGAIVLITACGAGVTNAADQGQAADVRAPAAAKTGQPITLRGFNGLTATVVALRVVDPVRSTDGFTRPDKGKRFVAVQFQITNVSDKAYEDTPSNGAKVIDGIGQQFDSNSGDLLPQKISAGPLLPSMVKLPKP